MIESVLQETNKLSSSISGRIWIVYFRRYCRIKRIQVISKITRENRTSIKHKIWEAIFSWIQDSRLLIYRQCWHTRSTNSRQWPTIAYAWASTTSIMTLKYQSSRTPMWPNLLRHPWFCNRYFNRAKSMSAMIEMAVLLIHHRLVSPRFWVQNRNWLNWMCLRRISIGANRIHRQ